MNVADAEGNMKNILILLILFILLTFAVCFVPSLTDFDIVIIKSVQSFLQNLPVWIPYSAGKAAYTVMIITPLVIGGGYFIIKKMYRNAIVFCSVPVVAYLLNTLIKMVIQRVRPPHYLHLANHPHSFSYVSRHTFVSTCLWGMVIYFTYKYIQNKILRNFIIILSVFWIIFAGFSRIWLGVHYPTDVLGAYILAGIILLICIKSIKPGA